MNQKTESIDQIFLKIFRDLKNETMVNAEKSLENILKISSEFVSGSIHDDLMEFYKLYFHGSAEMEQKTEEINKNVDSIFEQAQKLAKKGMDNQQIHNEVIDNEDQSKERVSLSYLQKKIESLISLEEGVRAQLAPVLSSMKGEDITRKRLETINFGLDSIVHSLGPHFQERSEQIVNNIANIIGSSEEKKSFQKLFNISVDKDSDNPEDLDDFWDQLKGA